MDGFQVSLILVLGTAFAGAVYLCIPIIAGMAAIIGGLLSVV